MDEPDRLFNIYDLILDNPVLLSVTLAVGVIVSKTYRAGQSTEDKIRGDRIVIADTRFNFDRKPSILDFLSPDRDNWIYEQAATNAATPPSSDRIKKLTTFDGRQGVPIQEAVGTTLETERRAIDASDRLLALLGLEQPSQVSLNSVLDLGQVSLNFRQLVVETVTPGRLWGETREINTREHDRFQAMVEHLRALKNKLDQLTREIENHLVDIGANDLRLLNAVHETDRLWEEEVARVALENARNEQRNSQVDGAPTTSRLVYVFQLVGYSLGISSAFEAKHCCRDRVKRHGDTRLAPASWKFPSFWRICSLPILLYSRFGPSCLQLDQAFLLGNSMCFGRRNCRGGRHCLKHYWTAQNYCHCANCFDCGWRFCVAFPARSID